MSAGVQIALATVVVVFVAFLAYGALTEGRRRPTSRADRARAAAADAPAEERSGPDARAGGEHFRREALTVAEDPILTPSHEEHRP